MADLDKFNDNPQRQLLEEVKSARCVMLGNPAPDAHMQPMAPQIDPDDGVIFFYSDKTSDLGQAILEQPATVMMAHIDTDYQACVRGTLYPHHDMETIEKFWGPVASSWYPGGKTDPKMMMLRFVPHDAAIWASDKSFIGFAYETAKANLTDNLPDVGDMKNVSM